VSNADAFSLSEKVPVGRAVSSDQLVCLLDGGGLTLF
jgi:hypothetical protein